MVNHLEDDLKHILAHTEDVWEHLRGRRLFISGGTGFFGCWLLESFAFANERLQLEASLTVLTRDVSGLKAKAPHLVSNPSITFHIGDIRDFDFPTGNFDYIIHAAATSAEVTFKGESPLDKFDNVVAGTRRILEFAARSNVRKLLYTSSGAVYGRQPENMLHIPESYSGAPDPCEVSSAWGVSKRAAELLCNCYAEKYGFDASIARCFSFVGPYLQLDIHYAIGNFIRDALHGGPIVVQGDGSPFRSYLYAADLAVCLWKILTHGISGTAYNVGSERSVSIAELAHLVSECFENNVGVIIMKNPNPNVRPNRYIPDTKLARCSLGLQDNFSLNEAIARTIRWYRSPSFTNTVSPWNETA